MTIPIPLLPLLNLLVKLYPDEMSIRRMVYDTDLDITGITFEGRVVYVWSNILLKARDSNKISALLAVALNEYPDNTELRQTIASYRFSIKPNPRSQDTDANPWIQSNSPDKQVDIFISYSHIDAEVMRRLRNDLRTAGFTVWTDDVGLEPGTPSWQRAIEEAIQVAHCAIVLMSPEAKKSKWVEIEVSLAEDLGLRIFPLLVRGEERNAVLFRLLTTQRIDLRQDDRKAVKELLVPALRRYLPKNKPSEVKQIEQVEQLKAGEQSRIELPPAEEQETSVVQPSRPPMINEARGELITHAELLPKIDVSPPAQLSSENQTAWTRPRASSYLAIYLSLVLFGLAIVLSVVIYLVIRFSVATPTLTAAPNSTPTDLALVANTGTPTEHPALIPSTPPAVLTGANTPLAILAATVVTKTNPKDGAVYVWIPPGDFLMGLSTTDTVGYTDERPQHKVVLNGFWIMQTEVTNAQYKRCVDEGGCKQPENTRWNDPTYVNHPVTEIIWERAKTYTAWVGGRLPTEAEWEKACRGTDGRIYPWGNQVPNPQLLNYTGSNKHDTTPVGSYPAGASPYGLFDMAGNVWEWTADWYDENYYAHSPATNPKGPDSGTDHPVRGGDFSLEPATVRCSTRDLVNQNFRLFDVGFRVVSDGF